MSELKNHVEKLIKSASETQDAGDAMRFAQAAQNAANAVAILSSLPTSKPPA